MQGRRKRLLHGPFDATRVYEDPTSNRTPAGLDGLTIFCAKCRDFELSQTHVEKLDLVERIEVLRKAQDLVAPGTRPTITGVCF
jgi:hypothetical protein